MALDPMTLIMFGLIAVLIIFMIRNGRKRRQAAEEMQSNLRPGAEVMLQSGIFGTIEEVDEADNRVTVRSGTSSIVVHRNAIGQIITPIVTSDEPTADIAPDDDPAFGERLSETEEAAVDASAADLDEAPTDESPSTPTTDDTDAEGDGRKA